MRGQGRSRSERGHPIELAHVSANTLATYTAVSNFGFSFGIFQPHMSFVRQSYTFHNVRNASRTASRTGMVGEKIGLPKEHPPNTHRPHICASHITVGKHCAVSPIHLKQDGTRIEAAHTFRPASFGQAFTQIREGISHLSSPACSRVDLPNPPKDECHQSSV